MKRWNIFGDDAAADLDAGIAGWLRGEIVGCTVNDQRAANDFRQLKPIGIYDTVSVAYAAQKRRQITGMVRMRHAAGIIMGPRFIKRKRAVPCLVDMHTIELGIGRHLLIWQTGNFRFDQYAAGGGRIKIGDSMQGRMIGIAGNFSVGTWA